MTTKISIIVKSFDLAKNAITTILEKNHISRVASLREACKSRVASLREACKSRVASLREDPSVHSRNQVRFLRLPQKRTLYTVLRSPHIDKKSREQFEMKSYKQILVIHTKKTDVYKQLLDLKLHSVPGVQVKVVLNYQTRLI